MSEVNFFLTCAVLLGRLLPQLKGELTGSFKCFEYYSVARDKKKKIGEMQVCVYEREIVYYCKRHTVYSIFSRFVHWFSKTTAGRFGAEFQMCDKRGTWPKYTSVMILNR